MMDSDEFYTALSKKQKRLETRTKELLKGMETITITELAKKLGWSEKYARKVINLNPPPKRPEYYLVRLDGPTTIHMDEEGNPETFAHYEVAEYVRMKFIKYHPEENWIIRDTNDYPLIKLHDQWQSMKNLD